MNLETHRFIRSPFRDYPAIYAATYGRGVFRLETVAPMVSEPIPLTLSLVSDPIRLRALGFELEEDGISKPISIYIMLSISDKNHKIRIPFELTLQRNSKITLEAPAEASVQGRTVEFVSWKIGSGEPIQERKASTKSSGDSLAIVYFRGKKFTARRAGEEENYKSQLRQRIGF